MELARRFLLLLFTLPFPGNPIPPSYLLMAYLCAYAFIQPYKSAVVNLVEVALCVDLLVMLLIVGDSAITEDLLYSHTTQLSVSQSNQDGCVVSGFTRFTGLLTPFYYLPLLAGVVCIAVGVASLLRYAFLSPIVKVREECLTPSWIMCTNKVFVTACSVALAYQSISAGLGICHMLFVNRALGL